MPESKDQGAIPQGLIEQSKARNIDPSHLQMLGKQAASVYINQGTSLNNAVIETIGKEDLGPEHTRRVCEFANQSAFQNEWEKGGAVRNVEFKGGPADPAVVLRELHDGARQPAVRLISDYDKAPPKLASVNVEEEIFAGHTKSKQLPHEIPSSINDILRLRDTIKGAQDHIFYKAANLEIEKKRIGRNIAEFASNEVLNGTSLQKIASAWSHFSNPQICQEAMDVVHIRMRERGINADLIEKTASTEVGKIPNIKHPIISSFVEFTKIATEIKKLRNAVNILEEQLAPINQIIKSAQKQGTNHGCKAACL
jgi:hypothetical protein